MQEIRISVHPGKYRDFIKHMLAPNLGKLTGSGHNLADDVGDLWFQVDGINAEEFQPLAASPVPIPPDETAGSK